MARDKPNIRYWGDEHAVYMTLDAFENMALQWVHYWRRDEAESQVRRWLEEARQNGGVLELTMDHIQMIADWEHNEKAEPRRYIPKAVRRAVMNRDGRKCRACGATADPTLDHIKPFSQRGQHKAYNLQVLCRSCNSRKRTMSQREWEARR